jgi:hypothetical protein
VKRILIAAAAIFALVCTILFAQIAPGSAHEWSPRHHYKHHRHGHMVYAAYVADYGACRVGWWQTLRYGHVRPVWGAWCR